MNTPSARRTAWAGLGVLVFIAVHAWWHWLALAGWVALCSGYWLWRLKRHPMGPCRSPWCQAGRNKGSDQTQWGPCPRCEETPGGAGEEPRAGAVLMHPELRRK